MKPGWRTRYATAIAAVALIASPVAADELQAVQTALQTLTSEQQALYQQFQMLQSLRANEQLKASGGYGPQPGPPRNYDDVVRERQDALARAEAYQADMDALYERHLELESQKQQLVERLHALRVTTPAPP